MRTANPAKTRNVLADAILLQRIEGLVAFGLGVIAYRWLEQSWLVFALLFLVPDLFMLGYLRGKRIGALIYNLGHTYAAPAVLALAGLALGPWAYGVAIIWVTHIGFDRMLGNGFKLDTFKHTHLSGQPSQSLATR